MSAHLPIIGAMQLSDREKTLIADALMHWAGVLRDRVKREAPQMQFETFEEAKALILELIDLAERMQAESLLDEDRELVRAVKRGFDG